MVTVSALWLPILLSSVLVFIASSIVHMVLTFHKSDYRKLPDEENVLESMRKTGIPPGDYAFPFAASNKEMASSEMAEKYKRGPVGLLTILPSGPPAMGKSLLLWFVYSLIIGVFVAYVTGRTLPPEASYLIVFRISSTTAFMAYAFAHSHNLIWKGQSLGTTIKFWMDGLIYGLLTAGVFASLWPN